MSVFGFVINGYYTKQHLGYGVRAQTMDCLPSIVLGLVMATVVAVADHLIDIGGPIELFLLVVLGVVFYLVSNIVLGTEAFRDAVGFMRGATRA